MKKIRRFLLVPLALVAFLFGAHFLTQGAFAQHQFGQNPKSFGIMGQIQGLGIQVNPTWPLQVDPTVTAITGAANAISATPTLKASANSDTLSGLKIAPTFNDGSFSSVVHYAINATGTVKATSFSGSGAGLTSIPASGVDLTAPGPVGSVTPNTGKFTNLQTTGTNTLGTGGTAFTAMGSCTVASTTITQAPSTVTCTGVPASVAVSVRCTGQAAFSTATGNALYCQANGTLNQLACNTVLANTTAMAYSCSWVQP